MGCCENNAIHFFRNNMQQGADYNPAPLTPVAMAIPTAGIFVSRS